MQTRVISSGSHRPAQTLVRRTAPPARLSPAADRTFADRLVLWHIILLKHTMLYYIILYCTILLYHIMLYNIILYDITWGCRGSLRARRFPAHPSPREAEETKKFRAIFSEFASETSLSLSLSLSPSMYKYVLYIYIYIYIYASVSPHICLSLSIPLFLSIINIYIYIYIYPSISLRLSLYAYHLPVYFTASLTPTFIVRSLVLLSLDHRLCHCLHFCLPPSRPSASRSVSAPSPAPFPFSSVPARSPFPSVPPSTLISLPLPTFPSLLCPQDNVEATKRASLLDAMKAQVIEARGPDCLGPTDEIA